MDVCISENPAKLSGEEFLKYLTTGWTGLADLPVQLLDENLQTTSWSGERSDQTYANMDVCLWECISGNPVYRSLFSQKTYLSF